MGMILAGKRLAHIGVAVDPQCDRAVFRGRIESENFQETGDR
jgi:hypothetical protein